jgi:transcriptional regulator with XRE-family HTH domain
MGESARTRNGVDHRRREIGGRFRHLREARGLSQAELAERAACSKSHICQIENGTGSFSFRFFLAACDALEADPAFVFARVRGAALDDLYAKFESTVATLGRPAVEFLLSLQPADMRILCERAQEVMAYRATTARRSPRSRRRVHGD